MVFRSNTSLANHVRELSAQLLQSKPVVVQTDRQTDRSTYTHTNTEGIRIICAQE